MAETKCYGNNKMHTAVLKDVQYCCCGAKKKLNNNLRLLYIAGTSPPLSDIVFEIKFGMFEELNKPK